MRPEAFEIDAFQNVADKGLREHPAGLALTHTPGTQVEDRHLVQLTDRRTVTALDIISIDLELGLGVHLSIPRQQQVLVALFGSSLLRASLYRDPAVKDRP